MNFINYFQSNKSPPGVQVKNAVLMFVLGLVCVESANQVYAYATTKQGLIALARGETKYIFDSSGLKKLNPKYRKAGFSVNSMGLRSEELHLSDLRKSKVIAFVGASTVMGELAETNGSRFSNLAVEEISKRLKLNVVHLNAGIAGYRISDQTRLLSEIKNKIHADIVVIYPGFNDVSDYCSSDAARERGNPYRFALPSWWVSFNTLRRQTGFLRPPPLHEAAATLQPSKEVAAKNEYKNQLTRLIQLAKSSSRAVIVLSGARAFSGEQDTATQWKLAASVRSYTSCMGMEKLNEIYDLHNNILMNVAKSNHVDFLDVASMVPPGKEFFGDATHFSPDGEKLVAKIVENYIVDNRLLESKQ